MNFNKKQGEKKPIDNLVSLDSFDEDQKSDNDYITTLNEIAELQKTISAMPVSSTVEENCENKENMLFSSDDFKKVLILVEEILKKSNDIETKFTAEISELNNRVSLLTDAYGSEYEKSERKIPENKDAYNSTLLRQLYDIKNMVGTSDCVENANNAEFSHMYALLDRIRMGLCDRNINVGECFELADELSREIKQTNSSDIVSIVDALNYYLTQIEYLPLNKNNAEEIIAYSEKNNAHFISAARKDLIRAYMSTVESKIKDGGAECVDMLPDIIALKNDIQHNKYEYENELEYSEILKKNIALISERDIMKNKNLRMEIKDKIKILTALEVKDLIAYPLIKIEKYSYKINDNIKTNISNKIDDLKAFITDCITVDGQVQGSIDVEKVYNGLAHEVNDLKNEIMGLKNSCSYSDLLKEIKSLSNAIVEKLSFTDGEATTFERIAGGTSVSLNEIVIQLDRLFDDIKFILGETETNIVKVSENTSGSLNELCETLNEKQKHDDLLFDNLNNRVDGILSDLDKLNKKNTENSELVCANKENIAQIMQSVGELTNVISQMNTKLDTVITSNIRLSEDINQLQDQMFKIGMVSVTEDNSERYESYHNLILDEMCALRKDFDLLAAKFDGCKNIASEDKINELSESIDNILSGLDGIMTKLEVSELSSEDPDTKEVEVSREKLSKSLDELKRDLSQLAEEISLEK